MPQLGRIGTSVTNWQPGVQQISLSVVGILSRVASSTNSSSLSIASSPVFVSFAMIVVINPRNPVWQV